MLKQHKQSRKSKFDKSFGAFKPDKTDSEILSKKDDSVLRETFAKISQYKETHYQNLINFNEDTRLPEPGEIIKIRTQRRHNAFTYILAIIEAHKEIDELSIITFNINEPTLLTVFDWLKKGIVKKFNLCVSDSVKSRKPKRYELIKSLHESNKADNVTIAFCWNHCKIALVKANDNYYVIEGSGNFSENEEVEQYVFENNKDSYDFDMNNLLPGLFKRAQFGKRTEILS